METADLQADNSTGAQRSPHLETAAHHPPANQALRATHQEQHTQPLAQGAVDKATRQEVGSWHSKANA
jgi:hypothetical protein